MLFNSIEFLFFMPIVVLVTFFVPSRFRYIWLLIASYFFYMSWDAKYGILLAAITIVTYVCALAIDSVRSSCNKRYIKEDSNKWRNQVRKCILIVGLILNFGTLFYFKYANFTLLTINRIIHYIGLDFSSPSYEILLPVGISFFIFQAVGYMIDVYRGDIAAEKNPLRYALFVSFFPQLVAGPIERSGNLLKQLRMTTKFDVKNTKSGLLTIAYGLFLKIVLADNIATTIDPIFDSIYDYSGMHLLFASILFAIQIYCDFNGYTLIAIGSAEILGYRLNKNFASPYLAISVKDFWRRWHISLTSWFRDYLYIPLGGNRKGKYRKQLNTMIVFLVSGLWHGAAWKYVAWGGINGIFCVLEDVLRPWFLKIIYKLRIKTETGGVKFLQIIISFILVDFTWIFFRANSFMQGIDIIKMICGDFRFAWLLNLEFLKIGDIRLHVIILFSLIIMEMVDWYQNSGVELKGIVFSQQIVIRWLVYLGMLFLILFWGHYGESNGQTAFIYFQF